MESSVKVIWVCDMKLLKNSKMWHSVNGMNATFLDISEKIT